MTVLLIKTKRISEVTFFLQLVGEYAHSHDRSAICQIRPTNNITTHHGYFAAVSGH